MSDKHEIAKAIAEAIVQAAKYANRDANEYSVQTFKNTKISGNQIRHGSIPGFMLKDGSIPSIKIKELDADIARIALAQIQTAEIDFANIRNVNITSAQIKNADIDYARVKDLTADSAYFNTEVFQLGVGGELYIGRLRVRAANIDFLQVGQLVLEDDDGNLHAIGVDADGNMTTKPYEVQYQNISDNAKGLMSEYTIFRGATPPSTPYVGQLWVNTTTEIISRCTQTQPTVKWAPVKASELHTSFIEAVEKGLNILSTGEINILNGGNLNIQSGGKLNIRTSGGINVESGGLIKVHSTEAIEIGGYPMSVGGANLLQNSGQFQDTSGWMIENGSGNETIFVISSSSLNANVLMLGNLSVNYNLRTPISKSPIISGQTYTLSFVFAGNIPSSAVVHDSTTYTALSPILTFPTREQVAGGFHLYKATFVATAGSDSIRARISVPYEDATDYIGWVQLEKGPVATDWSPAPQDATDALESLNNSLLSQIDGKVEVWYYSGTPTNSNAPASSWTTTAVKDKHVGDLYYDTSSGIAYRYKVEEGVYSWETVRDSGVTQALENAEDAQATADGKMQVFTGTTTPKGPYDIGDLWVVDGDNGFIKVSTQVRSTENYQNPSDWILSGTDIKANSAITELSEIASDNKITPVEKKAVKKEWDIIIGEYPKIVAESTAYNLTGTSAHINYAHSTTGKYKLLSDYIVPLLSDLTTTTDITGATFRAKFTDYYNARQDLLNAITSKARTNLADYISEVDPIINSKNRIWYQTNTPTSSAINDIWYDIDADPVKIYRANAAGVSAIVTSGNGWYDITSVALDDALKSLNSLGQDSLHMFQSNTRPIVGSATSGGFVVNKINTGDIWIRPITGTYPFGTKDAEGFYVGVTYRAIAPNPADPSGWLKYVAGGVLTPHITLDGQYLTLSGESAITITNPQGGNHIAMNKNGIEIASGSDLTIKDGFGGNAIEMDNTGMTLSSTGQLKLQSTDSIIIGGSPLSVGGANLLQNSGQFQDTSGWMIENGSGNETIFVISSSSLSANVLMLGNLSVNYNLRTPISKSPIISGQTYTLSFVFAGNIPSSAVVHDSTTYTALSPTLTFPTREQVAGGFHLYKATFVATAGSDSIRARISVPYEDATDYIGWVQLEKGPVATDWSPAPQDTTDALAGIGTQIGGLQTQVDGKIESWWLPTASDPSVNWTTPELKTAHTGDMWYNTTTKKLARWNGTAWESVIDQGAVDAYALAETAKDTADGKRRVFTTTPVPPYDVGDLWAQGTSGDIMRCQTAKASGSYAVGDWVKASKYTDDTVASAAASAASAAQGVADTAASNATNALAQLSDISADSKLTPVEKNAVKKEWDVIAGEKAKIDTEAEEFSVSKTAYGNAYNALNTYLNGASGLLLNLNTTSNITAATFRANFTNYYNARQDVLNAITSKAKTLADNAQTNLTNFIDNTYNPAIASKTTVFYGATKPTYTAVGDIWYESANGGIYRCTNVSTQAHTEITSVALKQALSAAAAAQTTANGKINTFVGSTTPTALAAGDLWLDTGNKNIWKRATAAGTGGWVQYLTAAGYLTTTGITIDGTDLTVKATGNLNLAADGNLNVQNGGNLNVLNDGDIEIENGGEINVKSGGKINVSAADLLISGKTVETYASDKIRLEVSVGGTNLLRNSGFTNGTSGWWQTGTGDIEVVTDYPYDGDPVLRLALAAGQTDVAAGHTITPVSISPESNSMVLSFWARVRSSDITKMGTQPAAYVWCYSAPTGGSPTKTYTFPANQLKPTFTPGGEYRYHEMLLTGIPADTVRMAVQLRVASTDGTSTAIRYARPKLERGNKATPWSPAPEDPASGVKTSSVEVNTDGIYMDTTGDFNVNAGVNLSIKGGSGANSIGISNNPTDDYFMWAGNASAASAPFSVKRDGSVKATKIQHEYSQSFWDMADATFPAEFPVYIPSGYTIDSVLFTYQVKKARTFAKSAASGGGVVNTDTGGGTAGIDNIAVNVQSTSITTTGAPNHTHSTSTDPSGSAGAHNHTNSHGHSASASYSMVEHTHKINLPTHAHGLNYGINEKTALATSSVLKVGATTIGTYAPNPGVVEIKAHMSANAWNTITVAPNNDARVVAYVLVKLTPL